MIYSISRYSRALCVASFAAYAPVVAIALMPGQPVIAAEAGFAEAVAQHDAGRAGDTAATERAVEAFNAMVKADKTNVMANAYLGSSYALMARDARSVTDKIRYTNRGLRYLDTAVALGPDDFVARLIRANVTASLPTMFGRGDTAVEDMLVLDKIYTQAASPTMARPMVEIYEKLVELAPEAGDWTARAEATRQAAAE